MLSILIGILAFLPMNIYGQAIQGLVLDEKSGEALEGANVFIANTQKGTTSDQSGTFMLDGLEGSIQLVVTYVGYEEYSIYIQIDPDKKIPALEIKLKASIQDLGVVDVKAKASNKRKKYLKRFKNSFIGKSSLANKCEIINPEVLLFEQKDGVLTASASDLLKIENRGTGYLILFALEKFELKGTKVSYGGKPLFVALEPKDEKEKARWGKEREKAFNGSRVHFIQAFTSDRLKAEGYELRIGIMNDNSQFTNARTISPSEILFQGKSEFEYTMKLNAFLQVIYSKENTKSVSAQGANVSLGKDHETGDSFAGKSKTKSQVSYLYALKSKVRLYTNGLLEKPELLQEYGHFATERVAEMMPLDFNTRTAEK